MSITLTRSGHFRRVISAAFVMSLLAVLLAAVPARAVAEDLDVVVTAADGSSATAAEAVEAVGGSVSAELGLIGGVSATVPQSALTGLGADAAVRSVTPDAGLQLLSTTDNWVEDDVLYTSTGSLFKTAKFIRIKKPWAAGYTGDGVDIALIDSGVVPVPGLDDPAKVINGPDLSFESQSDDFRYLDTYGHGTHMAGIIAGRDDGVTNPWKDSKSGKVVGIAPDARIVNVKVAGHDGAVDVSQVIAAIDWVVQHRNDNGMNIRVINLSFGTDSTQTAALDPLSFAVEQAWKSGIVVVVAAGNDGNSGQLRMPASNPYVIAVGAFDSNGTNVTSDDFLTSFTNCGVGGREYDVLAPGR
ncbi:MAG: S8 family serine peptidase, partial [Acidimicrobiia bacterium]|nr:S8 family serine peptidase [Acidimicrobiia bacterium]